MYCQKNTGPVQWLFLMLRTIKAPSTNGSIAFPSDFEGQWKILFAHPRDFTLVCSSEILDLGYRQQEFKDLNTQILVLSVDRMVSHRSWKSDLESIDFKGRGLVNIEFPVKWADQRMKS